MRPFYLLLAAAGGIGLKLPAVAHVYGQGPTKTKTGLAK